MSSLKRRERKCAMKSLVVSKAEAQKMIKVASFTMQQLLETGEIEAYKDGRCWKIPVKSLESYIERRCKNA